MLTKEPKEYELRIVEPGRRWRVTHRTHGKSVVERTYFVSLSVRRGAFAELECSCPAARFSPGLTCKHARHVANLIGRPELIREQLPAF